MSKGGGSGQPPDQQVTTTSTNLPEYAQPFVMDMMARGQAESYRPYTPYDQQRIADFNPAQQQAFANVQNLQQPGQFSQGSNYASAAGIGSLAASQYNPTQMSYQSVNAPQMGGAQMGGVGNVNPYFQQGASMGAAQTGFNSQGLNLQDYQIGGPRQFDAVERDRYMSPFTQDIIDIQKREALQDSQTQQLTRNLGAARQGTYGGTRQLLETMERERNLNQRTGDLEAQGLQYAYENAQQQFERDRAAQFGTNQANQSASLGVQQLGVGVDTQAAFANLSSQQQANVQNLAAQLQTQGLNAEQAMRAALANQGKDLSIGQSNLDASLRTQQQNQSASMQALLANQSAFQNAQQTQEQSKQFGASLGMQGWGQLLQSGQALSQMGSSQQAADLQRLNAQVGAGDRVQGQNQQYLDTAYADFLRQRDYPMEQLGYYNNLLRGMPMTMGSTQTTYGQNPSTLSQVGGLGLSGLGIYNMAQGG